MVCLGVFGLVYGIMLIAVKTALTGESGPVIKTAYAGSAVVTCTCLWFLLAFNLGLSNKKKDFVEKERGKGNWRIVEEKNWERFIAIADASKKRRRESH